MYMHILCVIDIQRITNTSSLQYKHARVKYMHGVVVSTLSIVLSVLNESMLNWQLYVCMEYMQFHSVYNLL